jgi:hypothetical protein
MDEISKGFSLIPYSSVFSAFSSKYDVGRISISFFICRISIWLFVSKSRINPAYVIN